MPNWTSSFLNNDLSQMASVSNFGAIGNGTTDDLGSFQRALSASNYVYVPSGTYRLSAPLVLTTGKTLYGSGVTSILKADNNSYDVINVTGPYNIIADLKTENGNAGIRFFGNGIKCVQNMTTNVLINLANYGLVLDGYTNTNFPCYWNNFDFVLVERPKITGVYLTKSGAGDSPNTNKFMNLRIHSLAQTMTGYGIYVEYGAFNNIFYSPVVDVDVTALSCIQIGANSNTTILENPYTETDGAIDNIILESGSLNTIISDQLAASAGFALRDNSSGNYIAYNAGSTVKNKISSLIGTTAYFGYTANIVTNTASPAVQIVGSTSDSSSAGQYRFSANNVQARWIFSKSRSGTLGTLQTLNSGDGIGSFDFNGASSGAFVNSSQLIGEVDATPSGGFCPGRIRMLTSTAAGALTEAFRVDSKQNVTIGNAALATTATDGFLYIPTCAGTPTGVPTSYTGRVPMIFDTSANKFWIYNGSWKGVVLS